MTVPVCSIFDIMARAAEEVAEMKYFRITAISTSGTAHMECASQAAAAVNMYRYGIGRVNGKGARQIAQQGNAYTTAASAGGKFTLATGLSTGAVVGETLDVCCWNEEGYGRHHAAARAAIEYSYPYWYREVQLDLNNDLMADGTTQFTMLTFDKDVDEYTPPSDLARLGKIGIQESDEEEVRWLDWLDLYDMVGQEGNQKLKFYRGANGTYLPSKYNGKTICWHYEAREPMPATLTTQSCQIPVDYAGLVAAGIYKRRNLFKADSELRTEGAAIPQLQLAANEAWTRMGFLKKSLPQGIKYRKK